MYCCNTHLKFTVYFVLWMDFCSFQSDFLVLFVCFSPTSFIFVLLHNSTVPLPGKVALKFKLHLRNVPPQTEA